MKTENTLTVIARCALQQKAFMKMWSFMLVSDHPRHLYLNLLKQFLAMRCIKPMFAGNKPFLTAADDVGNCNVLYNIYSNILTQLGHDKL